MLASITAVASALIISFHHQSELRIKIGEYRRYYTKSINLALCYRGFSPNRSLNCAFAAGRAAFYCCAYDVVTDWRRFDVNDQNRFKRMLAAELTPELGLIACKLYEQERANLLAHDGLSRGVDALAFLSGLMGVNSYIHSHINFQDLGIVMQIVDDVLDLEEDQAAGDINCLMVTSAKRNFYLQKLTAFDLAGFKRIFPHAHILKRVIQTAQKKAACLLSNQDLEAKNFQTSTAAQIKT